MPKLVEHKCPVCTAKTPKISLASYEMLSQELSPGWRPIEMPTPNSPHISALEKRWEFSKYEKALEFVNQVAQLAITENHHPDLTFGWNYVNAVLTTHAIAAVSMGDLILAAKIDEIYNRLTSAGD